MNDDTTDPSIPSASGSADANPPSLGPRLPEIEGYQIIREISRGGQAVVYEALQPAISRKVAIKVLHGGGFTGPKERARFDREVQVLAALNHPNVVQVIARGTTADGSWYLVMPYIDGYPLDEWLFAYYQKNPSGPPPDDPAELLRLFLRICDAVNAAHLRGVIHRDLKPSNIRIDYNGEPHILDFGLARTGIPGMTDEDQPQRITVTGMFLGSLQWASPEQAEGAISQVDMRSDVYSLGVILYQMLTGKFPYEVVGKIRDVLNNIMTAVPTPPSSATEMNSAKQAQQRQSWLRKHKRPINAVMDAILLKALAKRREERYQTAGEFALDITNYLSGRSTSAAGEAPASPWPKRAFAAVGVAVILGVVTVIGYIRIASVRGTKDRRQSAEKVTGGGQVVAVQSQGESAKPTGTAPASAESWWTWTTVWEDSLTRLDSPKRFWLFRGQYTSSSAPMITGEGMRLHGVHTWTAAWIQQPVGDQYALSVDFRWGQQGGRPVLWLNGPGYGNSATAGGWLDMTPSMVTVFSEGQEIVSLTVPTPMEKGRWYHFEVIREGRQMAILLDGQKLGKWEGEAVATDPLHAFIALGDAGGSPTQATEYRNVVLRMPPNAVNDLKTRNIERILDPPTTLNPSVNGALIRNDDFSKGLGDGWKALVQEWVQTTPGGVTLDGYNATPRVWRSLPLSGDFAMEWTISYTDEQQLNFRAFLAAGPVANADKNLFTGWSLWYPRGDGETVLQWFAAKPQDQSDKEHAVNIAQANYYAPVKSRSYVLRLEKLGQTLRVFSNGGLLLQAEAPANLPADQQWYAGFGGIYGPVIVHRIAAWQLLPVVAENKTPTSPRARVAARFEARLEAMIKQAGGGASYAIDAQGSISVDLQNSTIDDLTLLSGLPLTSLRLQGTRVKDLSPLRGMPLTVLGVYASQVTDLSPLQGMGLTWLEFGGGDIRDLSPLQGMPLALLSVSGCNRVSDLSPLRGLPLQHVNIMGTSVADLSPLRGMGLRLLAANNTAVSDLSPLQGMSLKSLHLQETRVTDLSALKGMPLDQLNLCDLPINNLEVLKGMPLKELLVHGCANLQDLTPLSECQQLERLAIPAQCKNIEFLRKFPNLRFLSNRECGWTRMTADEFWTAYDAKPASVAAAPISPSAHAEAQLEDRLKAFLKEAGGGRYELDDKGLVTLNLQDLPIDNLTQLKGVPLKSLRLTGTKVKDLRPLAGMQLTWLDLGGTPVSDLSPLQGMPLEWLSLFEALHVSDLSPLKGMPLTFLELHDCHQVKEITALKGMPLTILSLWETTVSDISALKGMPLKQLFLDGTKVTDLSALKGMSLEVLGLWSVNTVSDISPLRGMSLKTLNLGCTKVSDLSPLQGMPLESLGLVAVPATDLRPLKGMVLSGFLHLTGSGITDISVLRGMPLQELTLDTCKNLNDLTPLSECQKLERLALPVQCRDIEFLRSLPRLQLLGYDNRSKLLPVAEFWKAYDAQAARATDKTPVR